MILLSPAIVPFCFRMRIRTAFRWQADFVAGTAAAEAADEVAEAFAGFVFEFVGGSQLFQGGIRRAQMGAIQAGAFAAVDQFRCRSRKSNSAPAQQGFAGPTDQL